MLLDTYLPFLPPPTNHSLGNWQVLYASVQHCLISSCSTSCLSDSASCQNREIPNSFFRCRPSTHLMSKARGLPQSLILLCAFNIKSPFISSTPPQGPAMVIPRYVEAKVILCGKYFSQIMVLTLQRHFEASQEHPSDGHSKPLTLHSVTVTALPSC